MKFIKTVNCSQNGLQLTGQIEQFPEQMVNND